MSTTGQDGLKTMDGEQAVRNRYSQAARQPEAALCCPVSYNPEHLKMIPKEILEKDYGCGDPSPYVAAGDTVLDLGSGGGKLCYIAAQVVGASGKVIGVDCNSEMLSLARKYLREVADQLGFANVEFRCGRIQDLALNLELLSEKIGGKPVGSVDDLLELRALENELRRTQPMIASESVDCIVSNCVLNLVDAADRKQLFAEMYRVLRVGGRVAISDVVSDEDVPKSMQNDEMLWSGCISGAWREDRFVQEFVEAGFGGIEVVQLEKQPWQTVQGIEFRAMTVVARKRDEGPCLERNQAVIYRGPFTQVTDDDGQIFRRGVRTAVCHKTFELLKRPPYHDHFIGLEPINDIPLDQAKPFDCPTSRRRSPAETKGDKYNLTITNNESCCEGDSCC